MVGGQPLAEFETSTMVLQLDSPCSGVVEELLAHNGGVVDSNQPIIRLAMP